MVQGDTLFLNSKYAEYNGNVKSICGGRGFYEFTDATLETDTINFDQEYSGIIALKEP
jgi:hypothetical protein